MPTLVGKEVGPVGYGTMSTIHLPLKLGISTSRASHANDAQE